MDPTCWQYVVFVARDPVATSAIVEVTKSVGLKKREQRGKAKVRSVLFVVVYPGVLGSVNHKYIRCARVGWQPETGL